MLAGLRTVIRAPYRIAVPHPATQCNPPNRLVRLAPTPANGVSFVMRLMLIGIAAAAAIANASVPHGGGRGGSGIGSHSGHGAGGAHAGAVGRGCAGPGRFARDGGFAGTRYRHRPHWQEHRRPPYGPTTEDPAHSRQKSLGRYGLRAV